MLRYVKSTEGADPQARAEVEAQLRGTNKLLTSKDEPPPEEVAVAGLDGRQGLERERRVVAGGGQSRGAPGSEARNAVKSSAGRQDGCNLRVVDVREKISGAVIQELDSEKVKIKVGDRLQVDARQSASLK